MQTRHRIPTIFNLSMVDVLCCALGCIILLWLVYFKEARERANAAGKTSQELAVSKLQLGKVGRDLTSAEQALLAARTKLELTNAQLVDVIAARDQLVAKLDKNDKAYKAALEELKNTQGRVAALQADLQRQETIQS